MNLSPASYVHTHNMFAQGDACNSQFVVARLYVSFFLVLAMPCGSDSFRPIYPGSCGYVTMAVYMFNDCANCRTVQLAKGCQEGAHQARHRGWQPQLGPCYR